MPLEALFPALGIGFIGLLSIIGIGWTTNDNNAYTAGLALTTALYPFKKLGRTKVTTFVAVLGVLGAVTGLGTLGFFQWIAAFHGSFNMSFVGVLVAHYYIVAKDKIVQTKGLSGIIAWLISGLLTYFGLLPLPFITAFILAFLIYLVLYYVVEKPIFGENVVERIAPPNFNV
jgi:purine-cytosine permease-like protein